MRQARAHLSRPRPSLRAARPAAAACVLVLALLALAACSPDDPAPAPNQPSTALPTPAPSGSGTSAAPRTSDPQDEPSPTATASRPPDPTAPATVKPVERPGGTSGGSVAVTDTARTKATWQDGLTLTVTDVRRSTTGGRGRGSQPGSPQTTFALTLDNRSGQPVDVSSVVLTLTYGAKPARLAQQVYDTSTTDFTGVVAPGASTRASYAFVIPSDRSGAALVVDLDGRHALATLKGAAR